MKASWHKLYKNPRYNRPSEGFIVGGVLRNAGLSGRSERLPLQWVTGIAWQGGKLAGANDHVLVEVDSPLSVDGGFSLRTGMEYRVQKGKLVVAVRGGWNEGIDAPGSAGISLGFGYRLLMSRLPWGLDYAFVPWGVFGNLHALSLTVGILPPPPGDEPPSVPVSEVILPPPPEEAVPSVPATTEIQPPPPEETPPAVPVPAPVAPSVQVFFPLRGGKAIYKATIPEPAELSADLLDEAGNQVVIIYERRVIWAGEVVVTWDGLLSDGAPAPFDRIYRMRIQIGSRTDHLDVMPRKE